jgi:hypothetical protein
LEFGGYIKSNIVRFSLNYCYGAIEAYENKKIRNYIVDLKCGTHRESGFQEFQRFAKEISGE